MSASFTAVLPVFLGGLTVAVLVGAAYAWWGFRAHPLFSGVVAMHLWLALAALALWPEEERQLGFAYAGLLAAPFVGMAAARFARRIGLAPGAGIAIALYHAAMVLALARHFELTFASAVIFLGAVAASALAAAWLAWRGATSLERERRSMLFAAALALPMLPSAFAFFSFLGVVGVAPALLFLASRRSAAD